MTNAEKRRKMKKRADMIISIEETIVKGGALMILLRLLYKQKIKPTTAAILAMAYRFNDDKVINDAWDNCYNYLLDVHEVSDEPEKKDYKTMGFDIR